jgi:hypothetical protein
MTKPKKRNGRPKVSKRKRKSGGVNGLTQRTFDKRERAAEKAKPAYMRKPLLPKNITHMSQFTIIARAQVPKNGSKASTYFARVGPFPDLLFVKGPLSLNQKLHAKNVYHWKQANGLPVTGARWLYIYPDNRERNNTDRDNAPLTKQWFMFARSLANKCPIKPSGNDRVNEPVIDWDSVELQKSHIRFNLTEKHAPCELSERERADYILAIALRYLFGVGDPNDNNFFRANDRIFSLDEESLRREPRKGGVWGALMGVSKLRVEITKAWLMAPQVRLLVAEGVASWLCPTPIGGQADAMAPVTRLMDIRRELATPQRQ